MKREAAVRRVCFLLPTLDIGGAERVVVRTASGLRARGYHSTILGFCRGSGRLESEALAAGLDVHALSHGSSRNPIVIPRLFAWLRSHQPDAVLSYMFHANIAARLVGRLAGVRRIITSERVVGWETPFRIATNRATRGLSDVITTNSAAGVAFWSDKLALPADRIDLIYNGVDTARFHPPANASSGVPIVIGNLARLHAANGHATLVEALGRLAHESLPEWRCDIAGDGPERERLDQQCSSLGLNARVRLLGHTSSPEEFLRNLDLYVQPSAVAGMSNAVLEAMATGLPVVATAVGGTPEAIVDGESGLLVPDGDAAAMAAAVRALVQNADLRRNIGAAARVRVEGRFSVDRMVDTTVALIERT
jgi:glycosyltransferase involved in cell wall biosynthesis